MSKRIFSFIGKTAVSTAAFTALTYVCPYAGGIKVINTTGKIAISGFSVISALLNGCNEITKAEVKNRETDNEDDRCEHLYLLLNDAQLVYAKNIYDSITNEYDITPDQQSYLEDMLNSYYPGYDDLIIPSYEDTVERIINASKSIDIKSLLIDNYQRIMNFIEVISFNNSDKDRKSVNDLVIECMENICEEINNL